MRPGPPYRTLRERFYGRFERQIALSTEVEDGNIHAAFRNGTLTVTVPKSARALAPQAIESSRLRLS